MPFQFYCPQGHLLEGHEALMGQQSQCPICGSVFVMPVVPGAAPPGAMPGQAPGGWAGYAPGGMPGYAPPAGYGQGYGGQGYPGAGYPGQGYAPQGYPGGQYPPGQYQGYPAYGPGAMSPAASAPGYGQPQSDQSPAGGAFANAAQPAAPAASGEAEAGFPFIQTEPQSQPAVTDAAAQAPADKSTQPPAEAAKPQVEESKEPRVVRIPCPQGHELQTPSDMLNQDVLCPICGTQFYLRMEDSIEYKEEQAELRRRKAETMNQAVLKWSIISAVVIVLVALGMIIYLVVRSHQDDARPPGADEPPAINAPAEENDAPSADADTDPAASE